MTFGVRMKTYELVKYIFAPYNEKVGLGNTIRKENNEVIFFKEELRITFFGHNEFRLDSELVNYWRAF